MNIHLQSQIEQTHEMINAAIKNFKLDAIFALVSGGNDSMAMLYAVQSHPKFAGIIHIDTLTGVTDTNSWKTGKNESITTRHVIEHCQSNKIELIVKEPVTQYDQLVIKYGFPGAGQHGMMYRYLKERPLREAKKDARKIGGKNIGFITGVRSSESARRFRNVTDTHKSEGVVWIPAIKSWSKEDCAQVIEYSKQKKNPVSMTMGMSGECGCGSYASPFEKQVLDHMYPETGKQIDFLESIVSSVAEYNQIHDKFCKWGHSMRSDEKIDDGKVLELCADCVGAQFNRELHMRKLQKGRKA